MGGWLSAAGPAPSFPFNPGFRSAPRHPHHDHVALNVDAARDPSCPFIPSAPGWGGRPPPAQKIFVALPVPGAAAKGISRMASSSPHDGGLPRLGRNSGGRERGPLQWLCFVATSFRASSSKSRNRHGCGAPRPSAKPPPAPDRRAKKLFRGPERVGKRAGCGCSGPHFGQIDDRVRLHRICQKQLTFRGFHGGRLNSWTGGAPANWDRAGGKRSTRNQRDRLLLRLIGAG